MGSPGKIKIKVWTSARLHTPEDMGRWNPVAVFILDLRNL